jgi:hypothetical protein
MGELESAASTQDKQQYCESIMHINLKRNFILFQIRHSKNSKYDSNLKGYINNKEVHVYSKPWMNDLSYIIPFNITMSMVM